MNKFTCDICGDTSYGHSHNTQPLLNGQCCALCNMIFVTASRITGVDSLDEQIDYMMKMKDNDELPDMFLEVLDRVRDYQGKIFLEETAKMSIEDLNAKLDELEEEEEIEKLNMSKEEIIYNLKKAFDNAIKIEAYEAAAFIKKRIESLKS